MRYNVEMKTNRELGEKEGEARGLKIGKEQGRKEEKTKIIKIHLLSNMIMIQ